MFIVPPRARRVAALALGGVLFAGACAKDRPKSPADAPGVATTPASGAAAAPATSASPIDLVPLPPDTAAGELKLYRLSMERLQRWGRAQNAMNALTVQHPEILDSMKLSDAPKSLDQMIALIGSEPRFRSIFKNAGMNAHDYVITMIAMQQAMQGFQRVAAGNPLPADLPPALVANVTFVQQNLRTIQQILGPMRR